MNKETSNDMMKREFDILSNLPKMTPPPAVYDGILSKIKNDSLSNTGIQSAETEFEKLNKIKNIAPPAHLYSKILATAEQGELKVTVSKKWFAGAAALLAVLISIEVILVSQSSKSSNTNEIETLVLKDNYSLYE